MLGWKNVTQSVNRIMSNKTTNISDQMENNQDLISENSSLAQRVTDLEKRLDEALMIIADTYRYGKLKNLLAAQKWKEADLETTRVMIEITGKESLDKIKPDDIQKFPCNAIMVIDQLWRKYSCNKFGFSIQLKLYQSVGGNMDTIRAQRNEYLHKTAEKIGWRKNNQPVDRSQFNFCLEAPQGALPANWWNSPYGMKMVNFFLARLITCDI